MPNLFDMLSEPQATKPPQAEMRSYSPSLWDYIRNGMNSISSHYPDLYERTGQTAHTVAAGLMPFVGASAAGIPDAIAGAIPLAARGAPAYDAAMAKVLEKRYPAWESASATDANMRYLNARADAIATAKGDRGWWGRSEIMPYPSELKFAHQGTLRELPDHWTNGTIRLNGNEGMGKGTAQYMNELLAQRNRNALSVVRD